MGDERIERLEAENNGLKELVAYLQAERSAAQAELDALASQVTQLQSDRTSLASMWIMTLPTGPLEQVLPPDPDAMRLLGGGLLDVTGDDMDTPGLIVYMRGLLARMLSDAKADTARNPPRTLPG
jgi:hypothetical protein